MKTLICFIFTAIFCCGNVCAGRFVVLENDNVRAVFKRNTGALVGLTYKKNGWKVIGRAELGESFQMVVPIEGKDVAFEHEKRFNVVNGKEQAKPVVVQTDSSVTFQWNRLKCEWAGMLDISFTGTVTLDDKGLAFSGEVVNKSDYVIEYVSWPYLGEVAIPDKDAAFFLETKNFMKNIYPNFPNSQGYWGVDYPTTLAALPSDGYMLLRNDATGLCVQYGDRTASEYMIGSLELIPGYEMALQNPYGDEMDGQKVRISFKANRVLYAPSGSDTPLKETRLIFYEGSRFNGADVYAMGGVRSEARAKGWVEEPLVWRRIGISNASQLVNHARVCKECGVGVLLVDGWYRQGNKSLVEVVPGLERAIEECQDMGLKVMLAANFFQTSSNTELYRNELSRLLVSDPYGAPYDRAALCPLSPENVDRVVSAYHEAFVSTGADGLMGTNQLFQGKAVFCHDAGHGHQTALFVMPGVVDANRSFCRKVRATDEKFVMAGDYSCDEEAEFVNVVVLPQVGRSFLTRYSNPGRPMVAPIDLKNARMDINMAVLNQYAICYAALFGTNDLRRYPHVLEYVSSVSQLRERYRDCLWNTRMVNPMQASVSGRNVQYAVYRNEATGKRTVLVMNNNKNGAERIRVHFPEDGAKELFFATPEEPELQPLNGECQILPQSLVMIIEK